MKGKMKFDLGAIKGWLLAHGEKVAFGIIGLVFLMLVYSTLQRESLDAQQAPERMQSMATQVTDHVRNSTWDATREQVKVVNYAERAKSEPLPVGSYAIALPLNRPVADPKAKRSQPEVLKPEEMRVAAGMDIFLTKGGADGQARGQSAKAQPWAVVTALVPLARQHAAFDGAFAEAVEYDPKRDKPDYLAPKLERATINPAKPNELTWEVITPLPADLANPKLEIVQSRYVHPVLTEALSDLVPGGQWGESVAHPKTPLISEAGSDVPAAAAVPAAPAAAAPGAVPAAAAGTVPARPAQPTTTTTTTDEVVIEPHVLLRMFDYTVQPGRKYRYRVTLAVANPNSGIAPQFLENPESAKTSELSSQPTDPTAIVTIPDGHDLIAGPVDGGTKYTEPTAKVLVTAIDVNTGLKAATELDLRRGGVANTGQVTVKVPHPLDNTPQEFARSFQSNIMVLDIHGGKDVTRRKHDPPLTSPGEVLILDPSGKMTVRSELDDRDQFAKLIIRPEPVKKAAPEKDKEKATTKGKASKGRPIGGAE